MVWESVCECVCGGVVCVRPLPPSSLQRHQSRTPAYSSFVSDTGMLWPSQDRQALPTQRFLILHELQSSSAWVRMTLLIQSGWYNNHGLKQKLEIWEPCSSTTEYWLWWICVCSKLLQFCSLLNIDQWYKAVFCLFHFIFWGGKLYRKQLWLKSNGTFMWAAVCRICFRQGNTCKSRQRFFYWSLS